MTASMTGSNNAALTLEGIAAGYDKKVVIKRVDITVPRGEWFALLGPNGSGKTTLLHCAAGLHKPSSGSISIAGHSLTQSPREAKRQLGYGCAPERLPTLLTGRQCLEIYAAAKDLQRVDADVLELADEFRYTEMLDLFVDSYSLGTRQKLAVLLSLLGEPQLIILDEAFNGLDPASSLVLKRHLRRRVSDGRCGVLLATHQLDIVERYTDRAALLLNGSLVHEWRRDEIASLRAASEDGFEAAIAAISSGVNG
ncbi:MAG: ABC transporter ATP-binding protein [Gammaproteobacteria bacterium]